MLPAEPGEPGEPDDSVADYDSLINMITQTVIPKSWQDAGGQGTICQFETKAALVVSQTQEVHEEIAMLLTALRRIDPNGAHTDASARSTGAQTPEPDRNNRTSRPPTPRRRPAPSGMGGLGGSMGGMGGGMGGMGGMSGGMGGAGGGMGARHRGAVAPSQTRQTDGAGARQVESNPDADLLQGLEEVHRQNQGQKGRRPQETLPERFGHGGERRCWRRILLEQFCFR